jgi:hypothetical protein
MVFPHSSSQVSWPGESDEDTTTRGDGNGQELRGALINGKLMKEIKK